MGGARGGNQMTYLGRIFSSALAGREVLMHGMGPEPLPMQVGAWRAPADADDHVLLDLCDGPTLDVGCGPGRLTEELAARGLHVMGIDIAPEAVRMTRARGAVARLADVFSPLHAEGRWETVLLADGNIGIGGDVERLLRRLRCLLDSGGRVVAELASPGSPAGRRRVTVEVDGHASAPFWWMSVEPRRARVAAAAAGFRVDYLDEVGGRWFTLLQRED